jgi:hypothetical protein
MIEGAAPAGGTTEILIASGDLLVLGGDGEIGHHFLSPHRWLAISVNGEV